MGFLSKIFRSKASVKNSNAEQVAEETHRKQKITDGYPVTTTPFVPKIMNNAIVQKKIISNGRPAFGLTFSPETSNLVNIECLEKIRKQLLEMYVNGPEIVKELEKPIPSNTIAISFAKSNFQLGESCQDFMPLNKFKIPKDATFTYQKLSENLQATFYNENGTQFLAGLCYYPVPNGSPMLFSDDSALIPLVMFAAEPYPLQDREKNCQKVTYNRYGRDCGTAGKRVLVDSSGKYGLIRHVEYDHFSNKWSYTPCLECLKDAFTYKWEEPKREDPNLPDSSKSSNTQEQASEVSPAPSEKKQENENLDLTTMIKFLEIVGVQAPKIFMLSNLSNDARIPMINKITKETLPEFKCPHVNDLTAFMMANSDLRIDFSSLKEGTDNESEKDPNLSDSSKPSNTEEQAPELLSASSEKKQESEKLDLITVIKFLEMFGVPTTVLSMLSSMSTDTKIPMIYKATNVPLPESVLPQFKDLITFLKSNPDWCIDFSSLEKGTDNGTGAESEASSGEEEDFIKSRSKDSEVRVPMDSLTLSRTTTNLDAPTSSAFSETPSSASSTENLLEDFDKVEDATESDN